MGQPQFRNEPGKADEQRRIEKAFPPKYRVPKAADEAEPELHDQYAWILNVRANDGFAKHRR